MLIVTSLTVLLYVVNNFPLGSVLNLFLQIHFGEGIRYELDCPAYYAMVTGSISPGVKRPGRGVKHPPASRAEVKERVELYLYSSSGPSLPVIGRNYGPGRSCASRELRILFRRTHGSRDEIQTLKALEPD